MLLLEPPDAAVVLPRWLAAEQPGPLVAQHVLRTGNGACFVDRWPEPRAALVATGSNLTLLGERADAFDPDDLRGQLVGFLDAPDRFEPALRQIFGARFVEWPRIMLAQPAQPREAPSVAAGASLRRLSAADAFHVWGLSAESAWIANTWGGPPGLAASGMAWGAFAAGRLVAVACSFFVGDQYEDIGVVTESNWRGRGLSPACTAALCADIWARGHRPSWTTSLDNTPSLRVAQKVGLVEHHRGREWVIGRGVPQTPTA